MNLRNTVVAVVALACSAGCGTAAGANPVATSTSSAPGASPIATSTPSASGASPIATSTPSASGAAAAPAVQTYTVNLTDALQFAPAEITVPRGATITWINTGATQHTVTDDTSKAANTSDAVLPAGAQPWDSGPLNGGASFSHTFDTPGQYTYFCIPHEALGMVAHVTVTP